MQVFKPSRNNHELVIIPRYGVNALFIDIINELRNTKDNIFINGDMFNGVFYGYFSYHFKEGASYEILAYDQDGRLLFRGKAFATDEEDLQNYKLIK
jgi:hypothetical protein